MRSRKEGLPLATRARKLCPYRYVSRIIRTENFLSRNFFIVFLETTFLHVSCYPVYCYTILDSRLPLAMRSRKTGLPLATRARKWEICLYRYVSRMTRNENFLSRNWFIVFLETTFLHVSCYCLL